MPNNINSSIEKLPVEIIHRIFDNLDAEIIFTSVRLVSRLFRSIVNIYDRYVLNFKSISKSHFYILCQLINPENVLSLTLSNHIETSDQIDLFISFNHLQHFIRLRSLTLLHIDEEQLELILKQIDLNFLTTFSFSIQENKNLKIKTITECLTKLMTQSNLQKLEFDIDYKRLSQISWSSNSTIHSLTINGDITRDNLLMILEYFPRVHTLIINSLQTEMLNSITSKCCPNVRSLTIKNFLGGALKSFLLTMPSLVHLRIFNCEEMLDGKRWEEFITKNVSQLNKFEFYFSTWSYRHRIKEHPESILSSYQTPFWIKNKKWFVICEYDISQPEYFIIYSIPICRSSLTYKTYSQIISLSTHSIISNKESTIMNNIHSLNLTLDKSLADDIQEKKTTANDPLFPKVTNIDLDFNEDWPLISLQSLSIFIDISKIVCIKIRKIMFIEHDKNIWKDINIVIEQAHNLSSLSIDDNFSIRYKNRTIKSISSILPRRLKHLEMPINDLKQIKRILERCENLAIIIFENANQKFLDKTIKWFDKHIINTTCKKSDIRIYIWLGKKT